VFLWLVQPFAPGEGVALTLRKKTLLIMTAMLALFIAVLILTSHIVIHKGFSRIEEDYTRRNTFRAVNALNREIASLDAKVHDWAAWDDTYQFIVDRNPRYFKSNLVPGSFTTLEINFMIYLDAAGNVVFSKGVELSSEREIVVPGAICFSSASSPPIRSPGTPSSGTSHGSRRWSCAYVCRVKSTSRRAGPSGTS